MEYFSKKILKGSLDLIPSSSPSVKIQVMRCKGKILLGKALKTKIQLVTWGVTNRDTFLLATKQYLPKSGPLPPSLPTALILLHSAQYTANAILRHSAYVLMKYLLTYRTKKRFCLVHNQKKLLSNLQYKVKIGYGNVHSNHCPASHR